MPRFKSKETKAKVTQTKATEPGFKVRVLQPPNPMCVSQGSDCLYLFIYVFALRDLSLQGLNPGPQWKAACPNHLDHCILQMPLRNQSEKSMLAGCTEHILSPTVWSCLGAATLSGPPQLQACMPYLCALLALPGH